MVAGRWARRSKGRVRYGSARSGVTGRMERSVRSVERAVEVLYHLTRPPSGSQLGELARLLKLPKSTVHQILVALCKTGMVERETTTRAYRLGYRILHLSAVYLSSLNVVERALPYMRKLRDASGETVVLSRRVGEQRVDIAVTESPSELKRSAEVGRPLPLDRGAVGKIILASMPVDEARAILKRAGDEPEVIEKKLEELQRVAQLGYAVSVGERVPGAWSIAAPVLGWQQGLEAVLALSGPMSRFAENEMDRLIRLVVETAWEVSRELGADAGQAVATGTWHSRNGSA